VGEALNFSKSIIFVFHGHFPIQLTNGRNGSARNRRFGSMTKKAVFAVRLNNAMLAPSNRSVGRKMRGDCCVWGGEMWRRNEIKLCSVWR